MLPSTYIATTDYTRISLIQTLWERINIFRKANLCLCKGASGWYKCILFTVKTEIFFFFFSENGYLAEDKGKRNNNCAAVVLDRGGYSRLSAGKLGVQTGEVQGVTALVQLTTAAVRSIAPLCNI